MFRIFKKKEEDKLVFDERSALVDAYLRKAYDLAYEYEYHHQSYKRGGKEQLDEFIHNLLVIQKRIAQLETVEMAEQKAILMRLLDNK